MKRRRVLFLLTLATVAAGSAQAQAKVACQGAHPAAEIAIDRLPPEPVADTGYQVSLTVPEAAPANPWPVAMFIRCGQAHEPSFSVDLPGTGRVEVPLRFSDAGRWRGALMDRGGNFHSLGTFDVRAASAVPAAPAAEDGGLGAGLIVGGLLAGGAGAALWARRRSGLLRRLSDAGADRL